MPVENTGILRTNKICLLDADFIKHITDYAAQKIITQEFIEDVEEMKRCYRITALGMCENIVTFIRDPIIFCFSGKSKNTFRYHVAIEKEYKGGRKKDEFSVEDELLRLDLMHEAMMAVIKDYVCLLFDDLEADDLLCMLQDEDTYIHSKDKDLKQVPGWHYDKEKHDIFEVTPEEAYTFLAKQLLTGDSTDCIPGIKGIGPKTADKLLKDVDPKNMINFVFKQYRAKYGIIKGTDMFCNVWQLVKMRECHGEHFMKKYESAFLLRDSIKKNNLTLNP